MITQEYFLDMIPGESTPPVVHVSQFDVNSRTLTFNLMKGGVAFVPDAGMTVTLDGMKPDNHVFSYPMTVNGSSVSIDVLTQMTVVSGHVRCEVSVSNQSGKIGSANFILAVEESPIDSGSISESDIPIFEDLKNQAQQAAASAEQSASDASSAASAVSSIVPASAGATGQVLTKTATGADWETIDATKIDTSSGVAIKSVSGNLVTIADALQGKALGVTTTLEPIQDLHGYDHPWAGGAGKNKLQATGTSGTVSGVTFAVNNDGTVTANGTATAAITFAYAITTNLNGEYILNGCPAGASSTTYRMRARRNSDSWIYLNTENVDRTFTLTNTDTLEVELLVASGATVNNVVFKPMLRLATESDATFEPYSNICPITGRTQVDVTRTGKNLLQNIAASGSKNGIAYTVSSDGTVTVNGTATANAFINITSADGQLLSAGTYILNGCPSGGSARTYSLYDNGPNVDTGNGITFTLAEETAKRIVIRIVSGTTVNNLVFKPMIRLASETDATYEPHVTPQSVTVNLGQTVYGGTLNVTAGELTVETANIASYNGETIGEPWWSSMDEYVAGTTPTTGAQVVYTLATATTVRLTPAQIQLLTTTNIISTSADELSVRYYATGQTGNVEGNLSFLLDETARNEAAVNTVSESIAPTETGTATQNYATGSYLMLNNRLCKATSAIATGEQIIVGSNVRYTTVAEELTAILAQINA